MERAQMFINRWMDKEVVYIYTMQYYPSIKKNEILPFAMMWMELKCIMLSKTNYILIMSDSVLTCETVFLDRVWESVFCIFNV